MLDFRFLLGGALLSVGAPLMAAPIDPTEKWVVNFDDAQCIASREYGSKDKPLSLALKVPPAGDLVQMSVIRSGRWGSEKAEQVNGDLQYRDGELFRTSMTRFTLRQVQRRVLRVNVPANRFDRQASQLRVRAKGEPDMVFTLTQAASVMKLLDDCVDNLRQVWNVGDASEKHAADGDQRPKGDLMGVFSADDYPGIAIANEQARAVEFLVLIDEQGKVADCTVIETSGVAALDAQSCALVSQRARFQPALAPNGRPTKSSLRQRVTWRLE